MTAGTFRFSRFVLDPQDRRLTRDGAALALNARYFDALALLVREQGRLVSKDRFLDEVWRGVPVTDEALTQCIRNLRRLLGDDAARPKFIETAPKHGYRFIAPVEWVVDATDGAAAVRRPTPQARQEAARIAGAGIGGGGAAGLVGGLIYGFVAAAEPLQVGGISVVLVLMCLTLVIGLIGGAGVAIGVAAAGLAPRHAGAWRVVGGAVGGLVVGAVVKVLGLDAFTLLFGRAPADITGAGEGLLLGAAVGLGACLGSTKSVRRAAAIAGLAGAAAGAAIALLGGRLLGGSLDLLIRSFPGARLRLGHVGALFGEPGFGPVSQIVSGALEGLLFSAAVVGAMAYARRTSPDR
ncbi:transcriptional regulator [Phenylobacterium sp.]|uniref:transcriptional regulator n=1 Tax=Phenylobacterium sp. TaxID=1871053 RepID=UPI003783F25F